MACLHPVSLRNPRFDESRFISSENLPYIIVPCGHCYYCRKANIENVALRVKHEMSSVEHRACFVTFTFNEKHVPRKTKYYVDGQWRETYYFDKSILSNFHKNLRRQLDYYKTGLRYKHYSVLEFGHLKGRPHYHSILMGVTASEIKPFIDKLWSDTIGYAQVKSCDDRASYYCTKYMKKSSTSVWWNPDSPKYEFDYVLSRIKAQEYSVPVEADRSVKNGSYTLNDYDSCKFCPFLKFCKDVVLACKRETKKIYCNAYHVSSSWSSLGLGKATALKFMIDWTNIGCIPNGTDRDGSPVYAAIPRNYKNYYMKVAEKYVDKCFIVNRQMCYSDLFPSHGSWLSSFADSLDTDSFRRFSKTSGFREFVVPCSRDVVNLYSMYMHYLNWKSLVGVSVDKRRDQFYEESIRPRKYVAGLFEL